MDHGVDDEDDDDHLNLNIPEGQHQILSMNFFGDGTWHTDRHCYVSIGLLGRGGFSDVMVAREEASGEMVAIKRVYQRLPGQRSFQNASAKPSAELAALARVQHENVIRLLDHVPHEQSPVLVLELCASDLWALIRSAPQPLCQPFIKYIMQSIFQGLAACHAAGVIHRDLKPLNVLINMEGHVKITDFGMAVVEEPQSESSSVLRADRPRTAEVASRWYRAPELLFGSPIYDAGVDIWAAGCILAELLGMGPLFAGTSDIDQLFRVVDVLGAPDIVSWPQLSSFPDYGKISFKKKGHNRLMEMLPDASSTALSLLAMCLRYNPEEQPSAAGALQHPYFIDGPAAASPTSLATFVRQHVAPPKVLQDVALPRPLGPCPCPSCFVQPVQVFTTTL